MIEDAAFQAQLKQLEIDKFVQEKIDEFLEAMKSNFPGVDPINFLYGYTGNNSYTEWNHIHFNIPPSNKNLLSSEYYSKDNELVHFTTVDALKGMVQQKKVRLYNLIHLNDPREFSFAGKILGETQKLQEDARHNLFIMSFCEISILGKTRKKDQFTLWRLYGADGEGVAVVFSIVNERQDWEDFHLSKVRYGNIHTSKFKKLIKKKNALNKTGAEVSVDLSKLCAFHKTDLFARETEVRLLFDRRQMRTGQQGSTLSFQDEVTFPIIKNSSHEIVPLDTLNTSDTRYLELTLFNTSHEGWDGEIPLLKIEEVHLGYKKLSTEKQSLAEIEDLCLLHLGYMPKIKLTDITLDYYGTSETH